MKDARLDLWLNSRGSNDYQDWFVGLVVVGPDCNSGIHLSNSHSISTNVFMLSMIICSVSECYLCKYVYECLVWDYMALS